ncbi:hypothetical protein MLD38_037071 [Melastoma candidum]|uniref:Uncharacterized protein n=1 Tax=Melastoma candidum TaxID=119954 RepID=A0ACB9LL60_9MYRT|nr:hypothetical protein MLD38_037071 [Melastoma candidum]
MSPAAADRGLLPSSRGLPGNGGSPLSPGERLSAVAGSRGCRGAGMGSHLGAEITGAGSLQSRVAGWLIPPEAEVEMRRRRERRGGCHQKAWGCRGESPCWVRRRKREAELGAGARWFCRGRCGLRGRQELSLILGRQEVEGGKPPRQESGPSGEGLAGIADPEGRRGAEEGGTRSGGCRLAGVC